MKKAYKYTISAGSSREVTFDTGVAQIALQNANGEDGAGNIDKMKDVELTNLADNQILVYDSTSGLWKNENQLSAGDGLVIEDGVVSVDSDVSTVIAGLSYSTTQKKNGGKWIDNNEIYKKTIEIAALPNTTTLTVAHNVSGMSKPVNYECVFTDGTNYIGVKNDISISIDTTNITITTSADYSSYSGYVTIYYTLKKAFDKVLYTTDYSGTDDSSQYQLFGINGYNNRIWLTNSSDDVYIGLTVYSSSNVNAFVLSKTPLTVNNRYRRLGGGSQQGLSELVIDTPYNNKGYYKQIPPSGSNAFFTGNRMGIETVFDNVNQLLSNFFD